MKIRHHRFESFSQTSSPTSMDEPSSSIGHPSVSSHSDPQINIPKHPTFIKQMKQQRSIPPTESIIIAKPQKNVDQVVYTRRLVKIIPVSMEDMDENFDEDDWIKGCCGPDIKIVAKHGIPHGWVLIDDPKPQPEKTVKPWNPFDGDDPNTNINNRRANRGLPPIDFYNLGFEYTWDEDDLW